MTNARVCAAAGLLCLLSGLASMSAVDRGTDASRRDELPTWAAGPAATVRAEGRGRPWVHVLDGHEVAVTYRGDTDGFEHRLRNGLLALDD